MVLMVGNLKQGSTPQMWQESSTTLQHLTQAKRAKNYPVINHGRSRGLMQMIRRRMLAILADRETLREQLNEVPADGDPNAMAISIARVRERSQLWCELETVLCTTCVNKCEYIPPICCNLRVVRWVLQL